jgi:hypothetical protein
VMGIWPSVRPSECYSEKMRCQSPEWSNRYGSQRSPQGVSGYLHPPAHSTTLNKAIEKSGVSHSKPKKACGRASDANLFRFTVILACFFPCHVMQVIGVLWRNRDISRCGSEKTALHEHLNQDPV